MESATGECHRTCPADSPHGSGDQRDRPRARNRDRRYLRDLVHSCYNQLVG
jgi:hypothetical protein